MVEAIGEDLGSEIVRNKQREAFPFLLIECLDKSGISNLVSRCEVLGEDGFAGEFAIALRNFYSFAVGIIFTETIEIICFIGEVQLHL